MEEAFPNCNASELSRYDFCVGHKKRKNERTEITLIAWTHSNIFVCPLAESISSWNELKGPATFCQDEINQEQSNSSGSTRNQPVNIPVLILRDRFLFGFEIAP